MSSLSALTIATASSKRCVLLRYSLMGPFSLSPSASVRHLVTVTLGRPRGMPSSVMRSVLFPIHCTSMDNSVPFLRWPKKIVPS